MQLGAQDSFGSGALAAAADSALASRAEGLAVSLARAEAEARHLAAERDDLRRRLDDALAAAQASVNSRCAVVLQPCRCGLPSDACPARKMLP